MRSFLRYLILLSIMLAVTCLVVPRRFDIEFPRQPGPDFDRQMRKTYIDILDENKTDIVLIGDSTLRLATDPASFRNSQKKESRTLTFPARLPRSGILS